MDLVNVKNFAIAILALATVGVVILGVFIFQTDFRRVHANEIHHSPELEQSYTFLSECTVRNADRYRAKVYYFVDVLQQHWKNVNRIRLPYGNLKTKDAFVTRILFSIYKSDKSYFYQEHDSWRKEFLHQKWSLILDIKLLELDEKVVNIVESIEDREIDLLSREFGLPMIAANYDLDRYRICERFYVKYQTAIGDALVFLLKETERRRKQFQNAHFYYSMLFSNTVYAFFVTSLLILIACLYAILIEAKIRWKIFAIGLSIVVIFAASFGYASKYESSYQAYIKLYALEKEIQFRVVQLADNYQRCKNRTFVVQLLAPANLDNCNHKKNLSIAGEVLIKKYDLIMQDHALTGGSNLALPSINLPTN